MKKVLLKFSVLMMVLGMGVSASGAEVCMPMENDTRITRDPGDHWPWGLEVPFPWRGIQGTWATEIDGCMTYFTFKVVKNTAKENVLQVKHFDPDTCKLISKGAGYEDERIVTAGMTGKQTGPYNMTVHVFRKTDLKLDEKRTRKTWAAKNVTVMTMGQLGSPKNRESYELFKVSTDPEEFCPTK